MGDQVLDYAPINSLIYHFIVFLGFYALNGPGNYEPLAMSWWCLVCWEVRNILLGTAIWQVAEASH
jgi:hypothetical protein